MVQNLKRFTDRFRGMHRISFESLKKLKDVNMQLGGLGNIRILIDYCQP